MKLNYSILWIDDRVNESSFVKMKDNIYKYLSEEEFFNVSIHCIEDIDSFDIDSHDLNYDLIITDCNLGSTKNGDQVINEIRERSVLTEIFFYSANPLPQLSNLSRVTFYQLDSTTLYRGLYDEILKVISLTLKLFHNIISMRGMIMHETSYLDAQSEEILQSYINCNENGCVSCHAKDKCMPIADAIFKKLESHLREKTAKANKKELKKIINDKFLFSADYKITALNQILSALQMDDFSEAYKTDIINVRNQFAHAILEKDEKTGREYFQNKKEQAVFDENFCRSFRKNINTHKHNFDTLRATVEMKSKKLDLPR